MASQDNPQDPPQTSKESLEPEVDRSDNMSSKDSQSEGQDHDAPEQDRQSAVEDTDLNPAEERAELPQSPSTVDEAIPDQAPIYVETPAPYAPRKTGRSSRIRDDTARGQTTQPEVADHQPVTTVAVIPHHDNQQFFDLDASIPDADYTPAVSNNDYPCSIHSEDDEDIYTGAGCTISFVIDAHLSYIEVAIVSTDRRTLYEEDIISGSYLTFPYLALDHPVVVSSLGEQTTATGKQVQVLELAIRLDVAQMGIQNVLVPGVRRELQALKDYLIAAKANPSILKIRVNVYHTVPPVINGMLAVGENMRDHDDQFVSRWCKARRFVIQHNEFILPEDRMVPLVTFGRRTTFYLPIEYIIYMCIGDLEEYEKAAQEVVQYNGEFTMFLMSMPGQPADSPRMYLGLIDVPHTMPRLQPGDKMLVMDSDTEDPETALHGTVTLPIPGIPLNYMTVFLPLRWDKELELFDTGCLDVDPDRILPLPTQTQTLTPQTIALAAEGLHVSLSATTSDKAYRHRVSGLARLHTLFSGADQDSLWGSVRQLLMGNDIETAKRFDVYSGIVDKAKILKTITSTDLLNDDQKTVIQHAQNAPAGFVVIKGPPGTGKSYTARTLLMPFIITGKQVLLCGASNACTDDNAAKLNDFVRDLAGWQGQFVVRVYAVETEVAIAQSLGLATRAKPTNARPVLVKPFEEDADEAATETLASMDLATVIHKLYESQNQRKVPFVGDPRVSEKGHKLSVGHRILQLIGQAPIDKKGDPVRPGAGTPDGVSIQTLSEMYAQYKADVQFSQEQNRNFAAAIRAVRQIVLTKACCICTTPALATESKVFSVCGDSVNAVVIDEAGRSTEQEIVAVLSSFPRAVLKGLIGDNQQLPPLVKNQVNAPTFFGYQYEYSLLDRLINAGFPHVLLRTQYRMAPDIARVISNFGYQARLINHESVLFENRPMARKIRDWNKQQYRRERCLIYLNFGSLEPVTSAQPGGSRVNETFVAYGINLAKEQMDLNPNASVAIISAYNAQARLFQFAKAKLERQDPVYSKLVVTNFDAVQGDEFDVVIVDLLIMQGNAGFLNDPPRLNVGLSRARMALYVMADKEMINGSKSRSLAKIQSEMLRLGTEYKVKEPVTSQYFTSGDFALLTGTQASAAPAGADRDGDWRDEGADGQGGDEPREW